jgi:hypothetical protein
LEGLSDVGLLACPFFTENLVVGFTSLVVPRDVVLMAFVDALGVGSEMGSLTIDALQGVFTFPCIISSFLDRTTACGEQVVILGLMGLTASGASLMVNATPGSAVGP